MKTDINGLYNQDELDELAPTFMLAKKEDGQQFDILEYHKNYSKQSKENICDNCEYSYMCKHNFKNGEICYDYSLDEMIVRKNERSKTLDILLNNLFNKYGNASSIKVKDLLEAIKEIRKEK